MVDGNSDREWILDIVVEYLQSPIWKNPIMDFIDENCIIFEDEEENRLEYTEIHTVSLDPVSLSVNLYLYLLFECFRNLKL